MALTKDQVQLADIVSREATALTQACAPALTAGLTDQAAIMGKVYDAFHGFYNARARDLADSAGWPVPDVHPSAPPAPPVPSPLPVLKAP